MATKVRFLREVKARDAVLFTGLPGIGLVGKIVVDYLLNLDLGNFLQGCDDIGKRRLA